jgi:hypothetical protein
MKHFYVLFICLLTAQLTQAQEVLNNNPPSVKWYRIKSPHFRVLYAKGFEEQAQRLTSTLEHIRDAESKSMGVKPSRFPVILQNQSSISNGFVTIVPKRSELYTMPPQDYNFTGTTDWLNQLATHEFRHMVQFQRANTGFNRALYYLFGPATLSAMATVSVPSWFWEGDAVATETAFTHSGRGRIPNFGLVLQTNLQEGRAFNYNKQYLRSYKNNISDHYVLGYHMISYLRKRTGDPDIWAKIGKRTWSVPFIPFAFSNAIKKESGLRLPQLYREMVADLQQTSKENQNSITLSAFETITKRNTNTYTDYQYPQSLGEGKVLVMKSGIGDIAQFVVFQNGKESKVFIPGIVNDGGMLSVSGTTVVWNEFGFDPRWRVKSYSLIKMYDVATKSYRVITHKTRYSGAAISSDGKKIVSVESDNLYNTTMVVIDSKNGNVLKKFDNPDNSFYSMARWSEDGKRIIALKTKNSKRSVVLLEFESGKETEVIPGSYENIGHPVLHGNYVFYNSPVSGIDNIYAFDIQQQKKLEVTSSKYGAYNPSISTDGKLIYYNEQSRDGLNVVAIPLDPTSWKEFLKEGGPKVYHQYLAEQEGRPNLFDSIPQQNFATEKYSKLSGIINPYSWGAYFNSTFTQADIGLSSQDILSTTSIQAGYLFDIYERTGAWHVGLSYQNWYPIIDADIQWANRSLNEGDITYLKIIPGDTVPATENLTLKWKETKMEAGLRLPLLTTNSKYHGNFTIGNYFGYTHTEELTNSITGSGRIVTPQLPVYWNRNIIDNGNLLYNHFIMSAYRLLKQSRRDINSKWGQTFFMHVYGTPYGGDYTGKQFSFYSTLYFPGLFKHHSFWGYWGYQQTQIELLSRTSSVFDFKDNGSYFFRNEVPLPRGFSVSRFQKFYTMSANYTMPIWYVDAAMGPFVNIQRLKGNAFLDYGFGSSQFNNTVRNQTYMSVGGELKVDLNLLRYLPQFQLGVRYSYGLEPAVTKFEFLIGLVNF